MKNQLNLIRCVSVAAFTTCITITGLSSAQQPFPTEQKPEEETATAPMSQPDPDKQMRLLLEHAVNARLNPEVEKLRSAMQQMLEQTEKTREKTDDQVSLVANLMGDFLSVLGVVFTVLAAAVSILVWLGFLEIRAAKELRAT